MPEIEVDAGLARQLVREQFPAIEAESVELLGIGWDNTVFLIDGVWAFRFPRRQIAIPGVIREMHLLKRVASMLPLAIPVPRWRGQPSPAYAWPFFGSALIEGRELTGLEPGEREDVASALGHFLRTLHGMDVDTSASSLPQDFPTDPMQRAFPRARRAFTEGRLQRIAGSPRHLRTPAIVRLLDAADRLGQSENRRVFVHGDLHVRHVLVSASGAATGVIDWGDACLADPSVDISIAFASLSGNARAAFFAAHGSVDPDQELRARALAISISASLADHALAIDDEPLIEETAAALQRAVS